MIERLENVLGIVDGVNRTFRTPTPYEPNTLMISINGIIFFRDDDLRGYVETDPATGTFEMAVAPIGGANPDVLMALYSSNA